MIGVFTLKGKTCRQLLAVFAKYDLFFQPGDRKSKENHTYFVVIK